MTNSTNHKAPYQHAMILCVLLLCAIALGSVDAYAQLPVRTRSLQLMSNNDVNMIEHRAPNGIVSNFTYTWPSAYPTNPTDNFLTSTPTGVLAWANYDNLFWRLDGNAPATAASFMGPTSANVPLNLSTSNAVPGSIDLYIGPVAPANRRITLNNTSFNVGTIADPVATNLIGAVTAEGTTLINTVGTANTTIGNVGVGGSTVTLNAGTTGNIILGGVVTDATPTELLTITAGGQVRRSTMSGTAQEGIVYSNGAYRLGGTGNAANPLLVDRYINLDAFDLSFTSNGGADVPMLISGGVNSGVAMTTGGGGTLSMLGTTEINVSGNANTTIGNTLVNGSTVTINAGTLGDIVLGGVDTDATPTELLTITVGGQVRRSTMSGTAQEGIVYTNGAYRLGGTAATDNPFLASRFVNLDAFDLTFTSDALGANTPLVVTGGTNSGVALAANGTGNIVMSGLAVDNAPTEFLTITAGDQVRRSPITGSALEGVSYTGGAYRLGGLSNVINPFLADRFVNIDGSSLSFTSDGGASTTMLITGGANSGVAMTTAGTGTITMTGPTDVTGATTINTTGTANTTIGNTGVGATTVTLNAGTTGNIVLGGVDSDATPTEILTITATNEVRRSTLSGTAQEGIVFTTGAYRLGGTVATENPFATNRFVNIDGSNLSFTSNGGVSTTMLITGGANSGVAMTTAGTGTITMTGPTDVTGATTINTTGTANTTIGNTGVGATTITLNAGTTGNIVLGGVDSDATPTEILTITATNEVRRSTLSGTAQEGIVFTTGAYRLGGTVATENPFLTNRFVNIDGSNLSFTSNSGASTTMLITGGANSGVAMTTAGTGTITMTGPTDVTGATTINTTGTANTTIGNTGVGATTVTLNAGTTGDIVLGGVDTDATPTELLTITAGGQVRRSTMSGTAQEGIVYTNGAYRLGGAANTDNPFLVDRFVNVDASDLTFTANAGAETPLTIVGGVNSGVVLAASAGGDIVMTGVDVDVATTDFLTLDGSNRVRRAPVAGTAQEGITYSANAYRLGGTTNAANPFLTNRFVNVDASNLSITANGGADVPLVITGGVANGITLSASATGNIVMNGVDTDALPTELVTITAANEIRRSPMSGTALEGVTYSSGAYRLGGTTNAANPFLTNRFVNIDGSNLSFTSDGGASTTMLITGGANSGVAMTTAGTGTITMTGPTDVTGATTINTTGTANTTIGNTGVGATTVTLNAGTTGDIVLGGVDTDATPTELLTIMAGGQVRRSTMSGTAQEGIVYTNGAYRLGGAANTDNPFLADRFVNINASDLSFTANGGADQPLVITGGIASGVVLSASATGNIVMNGVDADLLPTDWVTIDASNQIRRTPIAASAMEGITYSGISYRLGGTAVTDNPFLTNRFVNIDGSNFTITSAGGANQPLVISGGANSGVALTADGTGDIVLNGVIADPAPTELLTITAANEVRRWVIANTALEGIYYTGGAYRLGGPANTDNPFLSNRFVNIDGSSLSFTSNGGASTTMLVTGGANSGVAMTTAGTGTLSMLGTTEINVSGNANTTIGNTLVNGSTVTINAGTLGDIVLGGVDTDATPTELLTITVGGQVRRSTMSGTAQEGIVYTAGAYRLGGAAVTDNPFLADRFVNVDGNDLTFTANGGVESPLTVVGGVNSGVVLAASAGGDIVMTGVDVDVATTDFLTLDGSNRVRRAPVAGTAQEGITYSANAYRLGGPLVTDSPFLTNRFVNIDGSNLTITSNAGGNTPLVVTGTANSGVALTANGTGTLDLTGTTNVNTTGTANTTIGNTGIGATTVTLNAGVTGDIVLGGVDTDLLPTEFLSITAGGQVRRSSLPGSAQEGIVFTTGAYRLGGTTTVENPFLTNRFVNVDGSDLTFTANGGVDSPLTIVGGVNSGVVLAASAGGDIVMTGVDVDVATTDFLTLDGSNRVRRAPVAGTAQEGITYSANAYRLGGPLVTDSPFLTNRFVNIDGSNLTITSNAGGNTPLVVTGTANSGVALTANGTGTLDLTGTTNVNTTGTANTTIGNTGIGATTVTLNAGVTGDIVLGGVDTDLLPTEFLSITAGGQVRRSSLPGSAQEGIVFTTGAYRLGGTVATENPFLTSRFVNIDGSNLSFTSNGGASTTMIITGGANSGVAMTTAGTGTLDLTGTTNVNTTGTANTTIGNTGVGATTVTLNAGTTGDIVLGGVDTDLLPTEFLSITAGGQVRRSSLPGSAQEGIVFTTGAYRLGGTVATENPFLTSRFVNIDGSNLSFTSNGGASTTMLITGGANSGVAITTAGVGTITMTGPTDVTGATTINTTGTANTTIGNTGVGATTITLNAGTTGNIVLGGVDSDATPTEILTITATNEVRRSTLSGTAQEGIVFTTGAYRLGGTVATENPFLTSRFVNIDGSNLSFTSNGGASTTMLITGGANSGVAITTAGVGTITMTGPTDVTGATTINTTGTANTTIGNTGVGATTVTLNAGTTGDIVLGGVDTDLLPTEFLSITAGGQVRRSSLPGSAQEGIVFTTGAYRLGGTVATENPFLTNRFVNIDGSNLSFTSNGGVSTTMLITGGANSGVAMTTAGTGTITMTGPTDVTGATTINTTGTANTTIGNTGVGATTVTLNAGTTGDIVLGGVDTDLLPTEFLSITAGGQVRRSSLPGSAQEGIVFTTGAYRLGGTVATENPFLTSRFVNIDGSNLSFTSNGGASTTMLITGGANSGVAMTTAGVGTITMTGPTDVTGATTINTTGTANTTIGNTGVGATTITLNAGTTGNIVLGGVDSDATPTEILTITATNEVRRSTLSGTAQEGIVFTTGAYRLGGTVATENPFLTSRFVNIDGSNLSFTSNGGASTTMLITGGANSGVAITTAGVGTITMTGPTDVTGATTINTTGTANTTIGNTGVGATTITLNAGTTGNIVLGGVDSDATPTEILTITATNEVRRSTLSGTAQEGIVFTTGAYRLGGTVATENPFATNRFVNIDGSNLSFTSNGGVSTTMLITGGANSGVAMTTAGTGTITMTGPTDVTGATTINTTGTANTTIGNTGVGATTVTLNAGTTGNIVLGGVDSDATPTEILTITATNEVRRSTLSGTAQEGIVFTTGAYRLGGTIATENPFATNRFVNVDGSNLSITANGGADAPLVITGGVANGVTLSASATGNIVMNGIDTDALPTELVTITAANEIRRSPMSGTALEGVTYSAGAYRLGGTTNAANPFLTSRFVNIDGSNLSFTSNGGASTTMLITGGANSGVAMTTAGTGTITMSGPTSITGTTTINTSGSATTVIGSIATGGAVTINTSGVNPITLDVGVNTNNLVLNNIATDAAPTDILTINASNQVRRSTLSGTAQEGIVFTAGAYRLGGILATDNPFLASRFVNLDASNLTFTANTGLNQPLSITGGVNNAVTITPSGTGIFTVSGTPGVENIRAGSLSANSADAIVAEGIVTADNSGDVRRRSAADALQILGIGRGIFTPAAASATHVIPTGTFDLVAGATINVTVFGPTGAAVHAMVTNVDAAANQITVVTSATVDATFSLHWMIINP